MLIWRLVFAHFVADYVLQTRWIVLRKDRISGLGAHSGIHLLAYLIALIGQWDLPVLLLCLSLAVLHGLTDYLKRTAGKRELMPLWALYLGDQIVHLGMIALLGGAVLYGSGPELGDLAAYLRSPLLLKLGSLLIINLWGGMFFTAEVVREVIPQDQLIRYHVKSGTAIGLAERFLITLGVLSRHWELIAFLIAAKSIIRLPEMRGSENAAEAQHFTNYFLLGTMVSYAWAISWSIIFGKLMGI